MTMDPQRFVRVRAIFDEVLDADLARRDGLLDELCAGDQ